MRGQVRIFHEESSEYKTCCGHAKDAILVVGFLHGVLVFLPHTLPLYLATVASVLVIRYCSGYSTVPIAMALAAQVLCLCFYLALCAYLGHGLFFETANVTGKNLALSLALASSSSLLIWLHAWSMTVLLKVRVYERDRRRFEESNAMMAVSVSAGSAVTTGTAAVTSSAKTASNKTD